MVQEVKEFHQIGNITIENMDIFMNGVHPYGKDVDIGLQVAKDGRIWICIGGISFLRFTPYADGKMQKAERVSASVEEGK